MLQILLLALSMVVPTDWLAANLHQPKVVILDVTTPEQYAKAHIPGAVLLDSKALVTQRGDIPNELPPVATLEQLFRAAGVRDGDRIILTSNEPLLATRAWFTLDYLGWGEHAALLDGGNAKWLAEKHEFSTDTPKPREGNFTANVDRTTLVTMSELKQLMAAKEPLLLIDGRDAKFDAGHIPGAVSIPWTEHKTLIDTDQLQSLYAKLDPAAKPHIVVYCRTGMQATMNYFALRELGFHPALYDGSYVEWSKTEAVATGN